MAIAFDAANSAKADSTNTVTFALSVVSATNGIICVGITSDSGTLASRTVSSVTYNGTSLTNVAGATADTGANNRSEIWYLLNTSVTGSHNVVVTMGGSVGGLAAGACSFTGVDQVSPIDASTKATGTGASITKALTTVADNTFIFETALTNGTTGVSAFSPTASQTSEWSQKDTVDQIWSVGGFKGPITPAGSNTDTWSATGQGAGVAWVFSLISLKPFVSGGTAFDIPQLGMMGVGF